MRVLCINAKPIICSNGRTVWGGGLTEGEIYTATENLTTPEGECYVIDEIDAVTWGKNKLCIRFEVLEDDWLNNILENIEILEEELECV